MDKLHFKQLTTPKVIVVLLGMHRSGTSTLARALKVLDVELGEKLLPPNIYNEKGYWEDTDIFSLNVKILNHFNADYQSLEPLYPELFNNTNSIELKDFKIEAIELLRTKIENTACFGFKDPRTARLLPFWQEVFKELNLDVKYVIALRNPMSVVRSLANREGFSYEKGYMLWYEYTLLCLIGTIGKSRLIVDYDHLLLNPAHELERISKNLNLSFNPQSESFILYQSEFVDNSLRHTQYKPKDLYLDSMISPNVIELFNIAYQSAIDKMDLDNPGTLLKLEQHLNQLKNNRFVYQYLKQVEDKLSCSITKAERDAQLAERDAQLAERDAQLAERDAQLAERDAQLAERDAQLAERDARLAERDTQLAERDARLAERDAQLTEQDAQLSEYKKKLDKLKRSISWQITLPIRWIYKKQRQGIEKIKKQFKGR